MRIIFNYLKKNKSILIIGLIVIIFVLLLIPSNKNKTGEIKNNPVYENNLEEKYSQPNSKTIEQFQKEDEDYLKNHPLVEKLPYITNEFEISHYIDSYKLVVYIKNKELEEKVRKLVNEWVKNQDRNINNHQIEFRYK